MTHSERLEMPREILIPVFYLYYITTTEDGKKRYVCKLDGKIFADRRDLKRHILNKFGVGYT